MDRMTITEALADIKTLDKRIQKKAELVGRYLYRQEQVRDPLEKDGGSRKILGEEMQSISDLFERRVRLRVAIASKNIEASLSLKGKTRSIAEWLFWRREVAPRRKEFLGGFMKGLEATRLDAKKKGMNLVPADQTTNPTDYILNVDELAIQRELELLEEILGELDGRLSLLNATTTIEVL